MEPVVVKKKFEPAERDPDVAPRCLAAFDELDPPEMDEAEFNMIKEPSMKHFMEKII